MVSEALSCITSQLDSIKDSYTTALVTYTLTLANHTDAQKMMKLLKNKAVRKGNEIKEDISVILVQLVVDEFLDHVFKCELP